MKKLALLLGLLLTVFIVVYKREKVPFKYIPEGAEISVVLDEPYVAQIRNFISDDEIEQLKLIAEPHLARSKVENGQLNPNRTSSTAFLSTLGNDVVRTIEERAANMIGVPVDHVEGLQIVRYKAGEEYKYHYDFYTDEFAEKRGSQRVYTFFVYLNDVQDDQEGGTDFPELGFTISPRKGTAVFWRNVDEQGNKDYRMLHAGLPVAHGEKWGANIWIHDVIPQDKIQS